MSKFEAKNSLTSRKMFIERSYYDAYAFSPIPEVYISLYPENTHNSWHREFMLYGKVDKSFRELPMEPYKPYLKSLSSKKSSVYALNFVADAFKAFQRDFLLNIQGGMLAANDPILSEINPVKGYSSMDKLHLNSQKLFSDKFETYSKNFNTKKNINDLDDFIEEVLYLLETYPGVPFTKSAFAMSRFCPSLVSGLSIEILDSPYSEDKFKKEMIDSPNFQGYVDLASKHGFIIDKNIPWRLIADLRPSSSSNSEELTEPPMIKYASQYNPEVTTADDIMKYFFVVTATSELDILKNHLLKFYNQFVSKNPINSITTGPSNNLSKHRTARPRYTLEDLNSLYGDDYWLELYIRIRNAETHLNYPKPALAAIIRVAKDIQKTVDMPNAMGYIINKFSGFDFYEGSLAHKAEQLRQVNEGPEKQSAKEIVTAKARSMRKIFF